MMYLSARRILKNLEQFDLENQRGIGRNHAAGAALRTQLLATLVQQGGRVRDVAGLDLPYAPPVGTLVEPLVVAARVAARSLAAD